MTFDTFLNYVSVFAVLGVAVTGFILHRMKKPKT